MTAAEAGTVRADHTDVRTALDAYDGLPGHVSIMYLQEQGAAPTWTTYDTTPAELDRAARDVVKADTADEPLGVYVRGTTVRPGTTGRGTGDDTVSWLAFRSDLDLGKVGGPTTWPQLFALFGTAHLPVPTYWQHSGGGYYPVWQLAEPVPHSPDVEQLARDIETELRRAWNAAGHTSGVDSCHDAARVWRLAGSVHRKDPARPVVSSVGNVSGQVYLIAELRSAVPDAPPAATWDGNRADVRRGTAAAFEATYAGTLNACRDGSKTTFRFTFFNAARNAHRMVAVGLRTQEEALADLEALIDHFWPGVGPNGDDRRHVHDALHNLSSRGVAGVGALASPWELLEPPEPDMAAEPGAEEEGGAHDSWAPQDLTTYLDGTYRPLEPSVGAYRADGERFLYPGREHAAIGEMEAGKSWFALAHVAAELNAGNRVIYVHFEESDASETTVRLHRQYQVPAHRLLADFLFIGPERQVSPGLIRNLCADKAPTLVVLDGQNEAMGLHGLDIMKPDGAAGYRQLLARPFKACGAAVLSLDHVVKDAAVKGQGYAMGSAHKGNGLDGALFLLENMEPFGKGMAGATNVSVTKDRPGELRRKGRATGVSRKTFLGQMHIDAVEGWGWRWERPATASAEETDPVFLADQERREKNGRADALVALVGKMMLDPEDSDRWPTTYELETASPRRAVDVRMDLRDLLASGRLGAVKRGRATVWGVVDLVPGGAK